MPPTDPSMPHSPQPGDRDSTLDRLLRDVEQLIAGSHLFRSLDDDGRRELLTRGRLEVHAAGTVILREGQAGESFFLIEQGVVEVSTGAGVSGELSLTTLHRGAFFGEVSVLTGSPRTATVTALTTVATVSFDRAIVDELLSHNPKARRLLDAVIAGRARDTAGKLARVSVAPPSKPPGADD